MIFFSKGLQVTTTSKRTAYKKLRGHLIVLLQQMSTLEMPMPEMLMLQGETWVSPDYILKAFQPMPFPA